MTVSEKRVRDLQRDIRIAAERLIRAEAAFDRVMQMPESNQRGKYLAAIANEIQLITDGLLHFSLGWSFQKLRSHRKKTLEVRPA